jgi:hypothetical protein
LAASAPEEAVDAFIARIQAALDCIFPSTTFGSGNRAGDDHTVVFYQLGQSRSNMARLKTHGGVGELLLELAHLYAVAGTPDSSRRDMFEVVTSYYQYKILDFERNEIVVYDWAPFGPSPVRTPHLHIPAAGSISLKQRAGSALANQKTFLGSLHLPTGYIVLEDIVELLIREFQVVPRRTDWEAVLAANRAVLVG